MRRFIDAILNLAITSDNYPVRDDRRHIGFNVATVQSVAVLRKTLTFIAVLWLAAAYVSIYRSVNSDDYTQEWDRDINLLPSGGTEPQSC